MRRTAIEIQADRAASAVRRRLLEDLRRLRDDAGVTLAALARATGLPYAYVWRIFNGDERPSIETFALLAGALGADLAARFYPKTGPAIHDRHQARIEEGFLARVASRWRRLPEVGVRRPVRGWIDVVLHEPDERVAVATEIESEIGRLEQQIRWSMAKAEALPSWPGWVELDNPRVSRLLVLRWTRATRAIASEFPRQLATAFPAHPADALASLTGSAPWPGPALLWARIEHDGVHLVDRR